MKGKLKFSLLLIIIMLLLFSYTQKNIIFNTRNLLNLELHAFENTNHYDAYVHHPASNNNTKFLEAQNGIDYSNFKGLSMDKTNINISFESKPLNLTLPVYTEKNRYYLPLTEIIEKLNGSIDFKDNSIVLNLNNNSIELNPSDNSYLRLDKINYLNKEIIVSEQFIYISMFDFCKIFNLITDWDKDNNIISLYYNKEQVLQKSPISSGRPALIRLEDITAGGSYTSFEDLEKLRIVADYLFKENIPFHVAWIPRYINPLANPPIDNDISKEYSMFNSAFLFTLDYLVDRNGIIGLHGYTHQYGNTISVGGKEFPQFSKDNIPRTDEYALQRVTLAINTAKELDIPCIFFEAPHYSLLPNQAKIIENYFDYMYEPYTPDGYTESKQLIKIKRGDRIIKYIPTPLDYLEPYDNVNKMISKLNVLKPNLLGSFFFHPYIDFKYISITRDSETGYPTYSYSENSTLHILLKAFEDKGFKFVRISDLN